MKKIMLLLILMPAFLMADKLPLSLGGVNQVGMTKTAYGLITITHEEFTGNCSGVLISPYHVLTAGHCILTPDGEEVNLPSQYTVRIGGELHKVNDIIPHPDYNPNAPVNEASSANDFGILVLNTPATKVAPIPLGTRHAKVGDKLYFYGYGTNSKNESVAAKRAARGKILVTKAGAGVFSAVRKPLNRYATSCPGDSGGAVVRIIGSKSFLVGSVSAGSTGTTTRGACKSTKKYDDDIFVDLLSDSSKTFIHNILIK